MLNQMNVFAKATIAAKTRVMNECRRASKNDHHEVFKWQAEIKEDILREKQQ